MGVLTASCLNAGRFNRRASRHVATMAMTVCLAHAGDAYAFPLVDLFNQDATSPAVTDLAPTDAQDLRHQLQLVNGLVADPIGWTVTPRIGLQEVLSDNVLQAHSPRRWDLSTYIAPGIAITGNTKRAQLKFDYSPTLILNARTGSQNSLSQQLNGTANITAIEELAFIDLRALSGVQSARGALNGQGTIGASATGGASPASGYGTTTGANQL